MCCPQRLLAAWIHRYYGNRCCSLVICNIDTSVLPQRSVPNIPRRRLYIRFSMLPLVSESLEWDTLTELLSQIDVIKDSLDSADTDVDPNGSSSRRSSQQFRPLRQKGRKASHVPYTTGLQRRKKAELDALRADERQLSDQLAHLLPHSDTSRRKAGVSSETQQGQLQWHQKAMIECEERVRSERQNRELKAIFRQHMKLLKSIRKILKDHDALEGMGFVTHLPTFDMSFFSFNFRSTILEELSTSLHPMYQGTDVVMAPLSDNLSVALRTEAKRYGHEVVIETTSNTPLMRPAHEANETMWRYVANGNNPNIEKSFSFNLAHAMNSEGPSHRRYVSSLFLQANELEDPLYAIVLGSFRKYEDKNRVIFVCSGRWFVPSKCLQFEDQYWSIVEQSPVPTEYSSVVRTYNHLRAKETDVKFSRLHKTTQDILLNAIAKMSRRFMQSSQNTFMKLDEQS